jgi:tetratricopeptide (TPR) repeat protein
MNLRPHPKSGRNDPCPCGSGRKFKQCCGQIARVDLFRADPPSPVDLKHVIDMLQAGRPVEAEQRVRTLIAQHPNSGALWQMLGLALTAQGKEALDVSNIAAKLMPDDAGAHNNLGNALGRAGQLDAAVTSYRRALALNPDFAEACNNLGNTLLDLGRLGEAETSWRRAIEITPNYAAAHESLGNVLLRRGKADAAAISYRHALAAQPNSVEAHNNLGTALADLGLIAEAWASYRRALELQPDFAEAHNNLGSLLRGIGHLEEAISCFGRAIALKPDFAEAHSNLGIALRLLGRTSAAEQSCQRALDLNPNSAATYAVLAEASADRGQFPEAEGLLQRALSIEPELPEAWAGIARVRKLSSSDTAWLAEVQRIAEAPLPPRKEAQLRTALGKYFDDIGDFSQAFTNYRRANELRKLCRLPYDRRGLTQAVDRTIQFYDRNWINRMLDNSMSTARPVFIVGMLRSGTTLAEQIIASHPAAFGAGELPFWTAAAAVCQSSLTGTGGDTIALRKMAEDYLQLQQELAPEALRIVDKMPANYLALGLIHASLPNARIIHMQRNPIDTCLSIYFQHFETGVAYANDLGDLAHYYGEYSRLMRHWRITLTKDAILELPYESLMEDQELWSRKMLAYIGLSWDPRCLEFHSTNRAIITASKWQVRQPISKSSIGRWRNYEKFLGPLAQLME